MTYVIEVPASSEVETTAPKTIANIVSFTRATGEEVIYDFGATGKIKKNYTISDDKQSAQVEFYIVNGKYFILDIPLTGDLTLNLAAHGAGQKIGDSASGCTPDDTAHAVERTIKQLNDGVWSARRSGIAKGINEFISAILRMRCVEIGTPEADAIERDLSALDDDTLAVLKKDAKVKAMIATLRAERAQAKADKDASDFVENQGDSILQGLGS